MIALSKIDITGHREAVCAARSPVYSSQKPSTENSKFRVAVLVVARIGIPVGRPVYKRLYA